MLSYKEYKLLNESLYGAFNLGLKNPNTVGGIVSSSNINGTEAALEAESEEAIEEAKKMKKKMDCGSDEEDMEKKVDDEEMEDSEEEGDEDSEESDEDSEEEGEEEEVKEEPKFMKKKAKKEWSEIVSDLESFLEDVSEEESLLEIRKGLELIKEGMKKGKKHKDDCDCPVCKNSKEENKEEGEGLTAAQKKLPKALQDAILAKKGKGKSEEKKCGKMMDKKCGKYMNEEEQSWWNSVNSMLNAEPNQKNWDGGWSEVGEVQQAVREESENK
jgi:hypothetical protein